MFRKLLCLSLLLFGSLIAEKVDNIEFQLPSDQKWVANEAIAKELQLDKGKFRQVFNPECRSDGSEFLTVNLLDSEPMTDPKLLAIDMMRIWNLMDGYKCGIIASDETSMLLEYCRYEDGIVDYYILSRVINSKSGAVMMSYYNDGDIGDDLRDAKNRWIKLLQNAKPVAN